MYNAPPFRTPSVSADTVCAMTNPARPLAHEPLARLAFGFGRATSLPPSKRPAGLLAAIADELYFRGVIDDLYAPMDTDLSEAIRTAVELDRVRARRAPARPTTAR